MTTGNSSYLRRMWIMRVLATVVTSVRTGNTTPYRGAVRWEGPNVSAGSTTQHDPWEIQLNSVIQYNSI